jgi:hypothetical protein
MLRFDQKHKRAERDVPAFGQDRAGAGRAPAFGRLHSSGTGVAEPDADASFVAKPIARFTPGARAKAIVPGIGGPWTTARFRIKLEPCGSS